MNMWSLLLTISLLAPNSIMHDFHVSKAMMRYVPEDRALQISMHIFLDDLELALEQRGAESLFLCTEKEVSGSDVLIYQYLQDRFQLKLDGKSHPYQWVGKEVSDDLAATWIYLEVTDLPTLREIEITHQVLTEVYDDQQNIIHLELPNGRNGYFLFDARNITETAVF
jgi:hypothetical protein